MAESSLLNKKLEEYINKYYLNQVIRGCLIAISAVLAYFLLVSCAEYFGNFSSIIRAVLFYSFLSLSTGLVGFLIFYPLLKLVGVAERLTHLEAAELIGKQFGSVDDKLINTLQLAAKRPGTNEGDHALLVASLDQRIAELRPIPFNSAIDLSKNKQFLKFALPPLFVAILSIKI